MSDKPRDTDSPMVVLGTVLSRRQAVLRSDVNAVPIFKHDTPTQYHKP